MVIFKSKPGKMVACAKGTIVFGNSGEYQTVDDDEIQLLCRAQDMTVIGLDEHMAKPVAIIYDVNTFGNALADALIARGYRVLRKDPRYWRGEVEDVDIVFAKGKRRNELREAYSGKPFYVFDWGYIARVNNPDEHHKGHWQLSKDYLNAIPKGKFPSDRFDALGLEIKANGGNKDGYILLIGQMPGDSAHEGRNHQQWLLEQVERYRGQWLVYRPHPRGGVNLPGVATLMGGTLQDALDGARLVVTFNSNAGHEALMAGVPVVCDPIAAYAELSGEKLPSLAKRKAFYNRVAYGQWKVSEVKQALDFILGGKNDL